MNYLPKRGNLLWHQMSDLRNQPTIDIKNVSIFVLVVVVIYVGTATVFYNSV